MTVDCEAALESFTELIVSDPPYFSEKVDSRLQGDFGYGAFKCDADIGRGVHGSDGLRRLTRHHEAARTFGRSGDFREGAVIVARGFLQQRS